MKLDKNYKVRVTPEQSRQIQELAFELGFEWYFSGKQILHAEICNLVLNNNYMVLSYFENNKKFYADTRFAEISADDLIALLTDLSKSAETPLQNIELTPEFEVVEPTFKVGDKVYKYGETDVKTVLEVFEDGYMNLSNYPHLVNHESICHATQENYEKLCSLFECIDFEQPPTQADIDNEAVDKLAKAMKDKLAEKREQGYHGWETCKHGDLVQLLINHVDEGDPVDVANFCAFLFSRGEKLTYGGT